MNNLKICLIFSNSVLIQWGIYTSNKETETWPITFTSVYACVAMYNANSTAQVIINRMPYNLTKTGFSHANAQGGNYDISYVAIGKKV